MRGVYAHGRLPNCSGPRIIPACAGFTTSSGAFSAGRTDHPRMRGVYPLWATPYESAYGSSPHARGLPLATAMMSGRCGIIPACAGFTGPGPALRPHDADHPRMRGVYRRPGRRDRPRPGSSPHARGLRSQGQGAVPYVGIIPACAGFTVVVRACRPGPADHPRMRGVYVTQWLSPPPSVGSSPHARGLPLHLHVQTVAPRIIPACAGFTEWRFAGLSAP